MRIVQIVMLLVALGAPLVVPAAPAQAANCEFVLGFKALHDLIPDVVGNCTTNEHHNPQNGDGLQETTAWHGKGGLLVWRKADNWTAFTDGASTWINGPYGLQKRPNSDRFDWEGGKPPSTPGPTPVSGNVPALPVGCSGVEQAVTQQSAQAEPDGSATWRATLRNPCASAATLIVDVRALRSAGGPPAMDAPTIIVQGMAPGSTTAISTKVPASASAPAFSHRVSVADATIYGCSGANNVRCLTSDPLVASAVWSLRTSDDGKSLLQGASDFGVRIVRRQFPEGVLGSYSHSTRIIALDQRLDASSIWVRGTVLAHELQHAVDDAGGKWPTTSAQCYQAEEAAFKRQAYIWNGMWQNYLPANVDRLHAELNQVTLAVFRDPVGFLRALTSLYERQCGVN